MKNIYLSFLLLACLNKIYGQEPQFYMGLGKSNYDIYLNKKFSRGNVFYKSGFHMVLGYERKVKDLFGIKAYNLGIYSSYIAYIVHEDFFHHISPFMREDDHYTIDLNVYAYLIQKRISENIVIELGPELSYTLIRDARFEGCTKGQIPGTYSNNYNKYPSLAANIRIEYRIKCGGYNLLPKLILKIDLTDRISDCSLGPFIIAPRIEIGFQKLKK